MRLSLSYDEVIALREGLDEYLPELDRELVRTDVHAFQHELNVRFTLLSQLRARLEELEMDQRDEAEDERGWLDQPGL